MARTIPVLKIDSLEQLAQRKDLKILVRSDSSLFKYASDVNSELARAIDKQLDPYSDYNGPGFREKLATGLRNGSFVYVNTRLTVIFGIMNLSDFHKKLGEEPLIDILHISEEDGGLEPYFAFFNAESDPWILNTLNKM